MAKKKKTKRKAKAKRDVSQTALSIVEKAIGGRLIEKKKPLSRPRLKR